MKLEAFFEEFIREYSDNKWNLSTTPNPDLEYERKKFEAAMKVINKEKIDFDNIEDEIKFNEGLEGKGNFHDMLNILAKSLAKDIEDCVDGTYKELLQQCLIQMVPIGVCQAFTTNVSLENKQLDGYAIGINEGMYIALQLMTKAIILESLQGDLIEYKRSGTESFKYSIELFLNNNPKTASKMLFWDLPAEIHGEISGYQSLSSMLIFQFIGLHEFAHIANNDLELMNENMMFILNDDTSLLNKELISYHNREYEADAFALRALNKRTPNPTSAWANFVVIYLFFNWLHYMLIIANIPSITTHPLPLDRAQKLLNIMINEIGEYDTYKGELERISALTKKWYDESIK